VNPDDASVKNFMSDDDFVRASMILAQLALAEDFYSERVSSKMMQERF
jgi:hypothetical protein